MIDLVVPTDKGDLKVSWKNEHKLFEYMRYQRETLFKDTHQTNFESTLNSEYRTLWKSLCDIGVYNLPLQPKILDVGSGVGITNFLAYKYLDRSKIFLVDKDEMSYTGVYFSPDVSHGHYHSWSTVTDAIESSSVNPTDFIFLNPEEKWPEDIDLITSFGSWCWHYKLDTYWKKAKESLKIGGKFYLEISNNVLQYENTLKIISEEFNSYPSAVIDINIDPSLNFRGCSVVNGTIGKKCLWVRRK